MTDDRVSLWRTPAHELPEDGSVLFCGCSAWIGAEAGTVHEKCGYSRCLPAHRAWPKGAVCPGCADAQEPPLREALAPPERVMHSETVAVGLAGIEGCRAVVTKRARRQYRDRPTEHVPTATSAAELLAELAPTVERVFLGDRPTSPLAWATGVELPAGWSHSDAGHYLTGSAPVWRFERADGRRLEVLTEAAWFGGSAGGLGAEALRVVADVITSGWSDGKLLGSPAATGRYLLQRSIPYGREWPVLDVEHQEMIRSTTGQGRIELFEHDGVLPAVNVYDARFSYAALCWGLGAGLPVHDSVNEYAGMQRGRYLVRAVVPKGWELPGIIGRNTPDGWQWPAEPGQAARGWVDGSEVGIALNHGWKVTIEERLLFPAYSGKGPLDEWADKLTRAREQVTERANVGAISPEVAELARAALRAVLVQSIGALHGGQHRVTRVALRDSDVPAGAEGWRMEGAAHLWEESTGQAWPEMAHPEWTAAIWGRCRARLLDAPTADKNVRAGLLHLPPGTAVATRTDAIWTTAEADWPDDGKRGRYRLAGTFADMPAPQSHGDLIRAKGGR